MKAQHTPGAWGYAPELSIVVVIRDRKVKVVADFGKCDLPEAEANARLIAAAPDLLAALVAIADDADEETQSGQVILATARAAIAKATDRA